MNREKAAWMVSIVLIALLAFQLDGTLAQRDDDYAFVRTLVDIQRRVSAHYVEEVDEAKLRESAIQGLLGELDPFSMYISPDRQEDFERLLEGTFRGVGIQLNQSPETGQIEVITPIDGSPAFEAGVMPGDIIIKVNGESIEGQRLQEVITKITGPPGTMVTLTVRRENGQDIEELDLTMERRDIIVPTLKGFGRKDDQTWEYYAVQDPKIAYLRLTQFTSETYDRFHETLTALLDDGMQGLILDLRFNPGGRLEQAEYLVDLLIEEGTIVTTRGRNRPEYARRASVPGTLPYFPLIVLVNEHSASASEIVAGSLMDNRRALVIGMRTYGKGSVQEVIPLDGGGELKLTVAYYYLPSGRLVHRTGEDAEVWGVDPQILVPMDQAQQRRAMQERFEQELPHRPGIDNGPNNNGNDGDANDAPATQPTTQPADTQLQRAIDTMIGLVVLRSEPAVRNRMEQLSQPEGETAETRGREGSREEVPEQVEQDEADSN
jgi:carboxyl-terminal processing protease